jgi:hypothetical protein
VLYLYFKKKKCIMIHLKSNDNFKSHVTYKSLAHNIARHIYIYIYIHISKLRNIESLGLGLHAK